MNNATTLGAKLRRSLPDYPTELLRAAHQGHGPVELSAEEHARVEQRWLELQDDIYNHIESRFCNGAFSLLIGTARWNAEKDERSAGNVLRDACWPVSVTRALEFSSNPLNEGWLRMKAWARQEELLPRIRVKQHDFLDQPEYWLDVESAACAL